MRHTVVSVIAGARAVFGGEGGSFGVGICPASIESIGVNAPRRSKSELGSKYRQGSTKQGSTASDDEFGINHRDSLNRSCQILDLS